MKTYIDDHKCKKDFEVIARCEVQGVVSKLLGNENFTVNFSTHVKIPEWEMRKKVLTLPYFDENTDKTTQTFLIAKEISECLFGRDFEFVEYQFTNRDVTKCVKDILYQNLIFNKYPGMKFSYSHGYRKLWNEIKENISDVRDQSFINRLILNNHFSESIDVPFGNQTEIALAERCKNISDVNKTHKLIEDIIAYLDDDDEDDQQNSSPDDSDSDENSENSDSSQNSEKTENNDKSENGESGEMENPAETDENSEQQDT